MVAQDILLRKLEYGLNREYILFYLTICLFTDLMVAFLLKP